MHRIKLKDGKIVEGKLLGEPTCQVGFGESGDLVYRIVGKELGSDVEVKDISIPQKLVENIEKID